MSVTIISLGINIYFDEYIKIVMVMESIRLLFSRLKGIVFSDAIGCRALIKYIFSASAGTKYTQIYICFVLYYGWILCIMFNIFNNSINYLALNDNHNFNRFTLKILVYLPFRISVKHYLPSTKYIVCTPLVTPIYRRVDVIT